MSTVASGASALASSGAPVPAVASGPPPQEVHDLTVAHHKSPAFWGIDLVAPPGRWIGIVGPNATGKSTLIEAATGLLPDG